MTAPRVKEHNFLSHAWLKQPEDHLILGTESGQLLLFRSGEFVCYLVGAPGGQTKITALLSYSQVRAISFRAGNGAIGRVHCDLLFAASHRSM